MDAVTQQESDCRAPVVTVTNGGMHTSTAAWRRRLPSCLRHNTPGCCFRGGGAVVCGFVVTGPFLVHAGVRSKAPS